MGRPKAAQPDPDAPESAPATAEVRPKARQEPAPRKHRPDRRLGDPRFTAGGGVSQAALRQNYAFVIASRKEELARLEAELAELRERNPGAYKSSPRYAEIREAVREHRQRIGDFEARRREEEVQSAIKRAERESIKQGKTPYFLKRREMREAVKAARFARMKESGKADVALEMERRRKDKRAQI